MVNRPEVPISQDDWSYLATYSCQMLKIFHQDGKFLNQIELSCGQLSANRCNEGMVFVLSHGIDRVMILKRT